MKRIVGELNKIEKENAIKILFGVESGSRLWRMQSADSDYDVRFVFIRNTKDYFRIGKLPDVISQTVKEIDMVGFDIFKFVKLLLSSNPSIIEWLMSDIIYVDDKITKKSLKKSIESKFNPLALYQHYRSMCRQNYIKYLKSGEMMTHKKYLYTMRGLINAKWVEHFGTIPPIRFPDTIKSASEIIPKDISTKIFEIIELKKTGFESVKVSRIHLFERYIEKFLGENGIVESRRIIDYTDIQDLIFKLLKI